MPEGAFNIIEFARQMGLKNVREMPIVERIQPVISVGDMEGLTPAQQAPSGVVGKIEPAVAARFGSVSIKSIAPGGMRILWCSGSGIEWHFRIIAGNQGFFGGLVPNSPAFSVASQVAPEALVNSGTTGAMSSGDNPCFSSIPSPIQFGDPPTGLYVPRGFDFEMYTSVANVTFCWAVYLSDVPASEHVPD